MSEIYDILEARQRIADLGRRLTEVTAELDELKGKGWGKRGQLLDAAEARIAELERAMELCEDTSRHYLQRLHELRTAVERQAEDLGLWFIAQTVSEAYLQQELRKLHALVEHGDERNATAGNRG